MLDKFTTHKMNKLSIQIIAWNSGNAFSQIFPRGKALVNIFSARIRSFGLLIDLDSLMKMNIMKFQFQFTGVVLNFVAKLRRMRKRRERERGAQGICWHSLWPQAQIHLSFTRLVTPPPPRIPTHFAHNEILINSITKENTLECTTKHQWQQASSIASVLATWRSWGDVLPSSSAFFPLLPCPLSTLLLCSSNNHLKTPSISSPEFDFDVQWKHFSFASQTIFNCEVIAGWRQFPPAPQFPPQFPPWFLFFLPSYHTILEIRVHIV